MKDGMDEKILKSDIFRNSQSLCDFVNSNDVEIVTIIASASSTDKQLYYYESKSKKK